MRILLFCGLLFLATMLNSPNVKAQDLAALKSRALNGDIAAQVEMGDYYDGRDCMEALKWYAMAAKQGQFYARMRIANYYALGQCNGIERNVLKGYALYCKIKEQYTLYPESQNALEQRILALEAELNATELEEAKKLIATEWEF